MSDWMRLAGKNRTNWQKVGSGMVAHVTRIDTGSSWEVVVMNPTTGDVIVRADGVARNGEAAKREADAWINRYLTDEWEN
jgi:hypothetical protein